MIFLWGTTPFLRFGRSNGSAMLPRSVLDRRPLLSALVEQARTVGHIAQAGQQFCRQSVGAHCTGSVLLGQVEFYSLFTRLLLKHVRGKNYVNPSIPKEK